jgi:hypothetical protein
MRRAMVLVGGATFACLLAGTGAAFAQDPQYPPSNPGCGIQLSASALQPDQTFTVTGTQGDPNVAVDIVFESTPIVIGHATTNAAGAFSAQVAVPAGAEPGTHIVRIDGRTSCATQVQVERAGANPPGAQRGPVGPSLAFTGSNAFNLVLFALVAMTIGSALVGAERRQATKKATIRRERRARRTKERATSR